MELKKEFQDGIINLSVMYIQIGIKVMNVGDTVKSDNIIYKRKRSGDQKDK